MSGADPHQILRARVAAGQPEALSPEQIDRILQHADECPGCAAELNEFAARAILAQAPELRLDATHAERLRARVLAGAAPRAVPTPARPASTLALARGSGWLAAAAMAVALITHHGFHEPLRSGWLAAAIFALVAVGLAVHVRAQRQRLEELERRMGSRDTE